MGKSGYKTRQQNRLNRDLKIVERYHELKDVDIPDTKIFVRKYTIVVNNVTTQTCIRDEFNIAISYFRKVLGMNFKKEQEKIDKM